ncbi:uncharacterized protein LOC144874562 [Branchiostoma floridae x Branchiostoma japonicum]
MNIRHVTCLVVGKSCFSVFGGFQFSLPLSILPERGNTATNQPVWIGNTVLSTCRAKALRTVTRMSSTHNTTLWTLPTDALNQTTQGLGTSTESDFTTQYNVTTAPTTVTQNQMTSYTEVSSERPVNESTFRPISTSTAMSSVNRAPPRSATNTNGLCEAPPNVSMMLLGTAVGSILATCVLCAIVFLVWYKFCHTKGTAYRDGRDNEEMNLGTRASADDNVSPQRTGSESRPPAPLPRSELQDTRYMTLPVTSASPNDIALRETVGNIR